MEQNEEEAEAERLKTLFMQKLVTLREMLDKIESAGSSITRNIPNPSHRCVAYHGVLVFARKEFKRVLDEIDSELDIREDIMVR